MIWMIGMASRFIMGKAPMKMLLVFSFFLSLSLKKKFSLKSVNNSVRNGLYSSYRHEEKKN